MLRRHTTPCGDLARRLGIAEGIQSVGFDASVRPLMIRLALVKPESLCKTKAQDTIQNASRATWRHHGFVFNAVVGCYGAQV